MKKEKEKIYTQYKGKHRKVKINNVCKYLKSKINNVCKYLRSKINNVCKYLEAKWNKHVENIIKLHVFKNICVLPKLKFKLKRQDLEKYT
jgi:hypothetical protein